MARNAHGGFSEKISVPEILGQTVPKWPKNRPFRIFLKIGSKDFLDIMHMIRGHYCAHFAKNGLFGKISVLELGPMGSQNFKYFKKNSKFSIFQGFVKLFWEKVKVDSAYGTFESLVESPSRWLKVIYRYWLRFFFGFFFFDVYDVSVIMLWCHDA